MAKINLKGNEINTIGNLPEVGQSAPDFTLTKTDLSDVSLAAYKGKKVILNIFPSLDTTICAMSVRKFNAEAGKLDNTVVLCISRDLPFAHKRFCTTEGLENVVSLSELRNDEFSKKYGVRIIDGPMAGLMTRAVIVLDENSVIKYRELVPEIVQEPDYEKALEGLKK
ncbi:MAG: thiol peroxidase [Candidatus Cloacimonetes bacterium]|nr:thiol peroxidase [Candidatus Cloacimonadota bacterium]MBL7149315.1 thiol peroxidase [Candidatus Cloacimonadota bacterium]